MQPSKAIASYYVNAKNNLWDAHEFLPMAKRCEEWLMSWSTNPGENTEFYEPLTDREAISQIYFAAAMSLCVPSENTQILLDNHKGFFFENSVQICTWLRIAHDVIKRYLPEHQVNVLTALSLIPEKSQFSLARIIYDSDSGEVLHDAMGWDRLEVFLNALPDNEGLARKTAFSVLARFPKCPGTTIHQHLVTNAEDERELFRAQISHLRYALGANYDESMSQVVANEGDYTTLLPGGASSIPYLPLRAGFELHKQPDFAEKLRMDAEHLVRDFFHRTDKALRNPSNAVHVHEITKAFIEAGIPPVAIISWCVFKKNVTDPLVGLPLALGEYAAMGRVEQDFYAEVYRQFLKEFTPARITESCFRPETLVAAYRLTGDKSIIKSASSAVRDECFGGDLGL